MNRFILEKPEPNLIQQNFISVNLNQTWTLKIVLKWTQTEPEPQTKVRIYFSISGCRWLWYTHNKSSGDHQQDQQFLLFSSDETSNDSQIFSQWTRTEPEPVIFYLSEPELNLKLENGAQVNPNQTWAAKIFWAGAKPEPEPLFETVQHPGPKPFSTICTMRKYVLLRLTIYHWQPCFSQFCDITQGVL